MPLALQEFANVARNNSQVNLLQIPNPIPPCFFWGEGGTHFPLREPMHIILLIVISPHKYWDIAVIIPWHACLGTLKIGIALHGIACVIALSIPIFHQKKVSFSLQTLRMIQTRSTEYWKESDLSILTIGGSPKYLSLIDILSWYWWKCKPPLQSINRTWTKNHTWLPSLTNWPAAAQ